MLANPNLNDVEVGYKVFSRSALAGIRIEAKRFGCERELVAKLAAQRLRVYEVPIRGRGPTYAEGEKTGLADAREARRLILRFEARNRSTSSLLSRRRPRCPDAEAGSRRRPAEVGVAQPERASMEVGDHPRERKTQTGPAAASCGIETDEAFEDALALVGRNPRAGIEHAKAHVGGPVADLHAHAGPLFGVAERVLEQVRERALEERPVASGGAIEAAPTRVGPGL